MPIFKNRIGERYGRLVVISQAERSEKRKGVRWNCKCDCGNEKIVYSDELSSGKSNSCGCLKNEHLHNIGFQFRGNSNRKEQLIRYLYKSSRIKKIGGDLDYENFKKLILQPCYYCGELHSNYSNDIRSGKKISDTILYYNGIDRIDSNKGYDLDNVVTCCKICNRAKNDMKQDDFYKWIKKISDFNK